MRYHLLLVEDDSEIREIISDYFLSITENDFSVDMASDGEKGMELLYENTYDLVMLDIMLPLCDGFELCRQIRQDDDTPVIFLTARGREEDFLNGYKMGCDDYITKPFSLSVLYAKVMALLKRSKGFVLSQEIVCGRITLRPAQSVIMVDNTELTLPPKEYSMLKYLMEHKGQVISRETLLIKIWGYEYEGRGRVVDDHIRKLRKSLGPAANQIKTVITKGYQIKE